MKYDDWQRMFEYPVFILLGKGYSAVFEDPIRPEVKSAVLTMANAGIRTIMLTGDNPATAAFVVESVGLDAAKVVTGAEINNYSVRELIDTLRRKQVFARTTSEYKLRIVEALKRVR